MLPFRTVSTLLEIEAAADALPLEQKKKLLDFVAARINGGAAKKPSDLRWTNSPEPCVCARARSAWQQRVRGEWE